MSARLAGRVRTTSSAVVAVALALGVAGSAGGVESTVSFRPGLLPALHNGARIALGGVEEAGLREPAALAAPLGAGSTGGYGPHVAALELSSLSEPLALDPSAPYVVGLTWEGDAGIRTEARYFRDGGWEAWEGLEADDRGGDRPGSENLFGTEPYILSGVDALQVRSYTADGNPVALDVLIYSSEVTAADVALTDELAVASPSSAPARLVEVPQPPIHGRAEWGARAPTDWFEETYVEGAAVHHTAGVNNYSRAEVPGIIRSIQDLHMNGREFWDIGYNFLIDKYGVIWEGRAGGVEATARGAHSHTFNPRVTGVSIMGNFQQVTVPKAALDSLVSLLAWKLTLHGASADGILLHEGVWPAIIGHRDIPEAITSCPGIWLYGLLPEIRQRVTAAQHLPEAPYATDVTGDGIADIVAVFDDSVVVHGSAFGVNPTASLPDAIEPSVAEGAFGLGRDPSAPFEGIETVATLARPYDLVTAGPSLAGGPGVDVLARERVTGMIVRLPEAGTGMLGEPIELLVAPTADFLLSPGDITGDGLPDIVLADGSAGIISVRAGDGAGYMGRPVLALRVEGALSALGFAGDVNADGVPDLVLGLGADGDIAVALGRGDGTFGEPIVLTDAWDGFDEIAPMGDVNEDGFGDVVARRSSDGLTRTLLGSADGLTGDFVDWASPTVTLRNPMAAPGWRGDAGVALLALDAGGGTLVRALAPEPPPVEGPPGATRITLSGVRDAFVVGDVDANGLADVVTWQRDGSLLLHLSTGDGFAAPILMDDPGDNSVYDMLPNRPLDLPLPPAVVTPEDDPPLPGDLPVIPPPSGVWRIPDTEDLPKDAPFWSEYTSIAGAGDIDFDGTPDLVAVTNRGEVLVFTWDPTDPSRVERGLPVALGLVGHHVVGVGPWRPGSISDLIAVSPTGKVLFINGRGMTGGHVSAPVDSGWHVGDDFQALGQVGPGVRPVVFVVGADGDQAEAYSWTANGDWVLVASEAD